jgi:L-aspartate oxidase
LTPAKGSERTEADLVIVGSGAAGLSAALAAAGGVRSLVSDGTTPVDPPGRILLLTRGRLGRDGASTMAQGGVAAALHQSDSPDLHALDTVLAGAGLSRQDRVSILTTEGPGRVRELLGMGARFDRDASGSLALAMEGAHSRRRVIHAHGDRTGAEVSRVLADAVRADPRIEVVEGAELLDLVVEAGRLTGVRIRVTASGTPPHEVDETTGRPVGTHAVILATGGPCHLYLKTTTPPSSTGTGIAMAARAGARLTDMEFVQFHPTAMAVEADPLPLVTEALRGEGAVLVDRRGRGLHFPDDGGDLSSRDLVARTLWLELREGREVFLDARAAPGADFPRRFPGVYALCREHGIDPVREPIPVTPAAHYHMGGVEVDEEGRTSLPGLWAAGEVASTGVHGANRLASNSLLEGLVFGARAGESARRTLEGGVWEWREERETPELAPSPLPAPSEGSATPPTENAPPLPSEGAQRLRLRTLLWEKVGVVRHRTDLEEALSRIESMARELPISSALRDPLLVAHRITTGALRREESRGSHYRSDYPNPVDR